MLSPGKNAISLTDVFIELAHLHNVRDRTAKTSSERGSVCRRIEGPAVDLPYPTGHLICISPLLANTARHKCIMQISPP